MLYKLQPGDTLVADGFYCTYWLVAACQHKSVHIVMKNYDNRPEDPLGAMRIDRRQRTTVWLKAQRLDWVIPQEHHQLPEQLKVRLVDTVIDKPGFRSKKHTVATTMLNEKVHTHCQLQKQLG